jgi:hypothetical protein
MAAPTMHLSQSAWAASAEEARFRITTTLAPARNARVIALDPVATAVARRVAAAPWAQARFYACQDTDGDDPLLRELDGPTSPLHTVVSGTDVVVVLASEDSGRAIAAAVGRACTERAVTTAGIVLGDGFEADAAVAALRPHARVLLLFADESDVTELLTALRV